MLPRARASSSTAFGDCAAAATLIASLPVRNVSAYRPGICERFDDRWPLAGHRPSMVGRVDYSRRRVGSMRSFFTNCPRVGFWCRRGGGAGTVPCAATTLGNAMALRLRQQAVGDFLCFKNRPRGLMTAASGLIRADAWAAEVRAALVRRGG